MNFSLVLIMLKLIWLICFITVFLNWSSTKARQHTNNYLSYTGSENVISCIEACTPKNSETVRNKRQSVKAKVAQIFVTAWQESVKASRNSLNTFCEDLDGDSVVIECVQKCQEIYQNMRLQNVIDIMSYYFELENKTCTNQDETKLKCLNDAKKIFGPILLGKACKEEVDDFMAFGVDQSFDNEITISDEELTTLFDCPAETAKKSANDDCKDFVYKVIKKLGETSMNMALMGFEEGMKQVKAMQQQSTNGVEFKLMLTKKVKKMIVKEANVLSIVIVEVPEGVITKEVTNRRVQIDADQESQEDDSQGSQRVINSYRRGARRGYNQRSYGNNQRYQDE
uniref:Uncharacterized protein n=1 Tax=Acrobeloides nanus TaxID=290746 RepID=A0A914E9T7_9BILA